MKSAEEFESVYRRLPVRVVDHEATNGVLILNGPESVLQTSGVAFHLHQPRNENGWFDLRVIGPDGKVMLLHNAILLSAASHNWKQGEKPSHTAEIYPNYVIDDIRGLDENNCAQRVIFRITGLQNFFYYRHAEPLLGFNGSKEQIEALKAMRFSEFDSGDFFAPEIVYVAHKFPSYFSSKIEDRIYEIYAGGRETFGPQKVGYEAFPIASITFDTPTPFDDVLGHVLAWRRLFSQLAMMPLAIEEISVQASSSETAPLADVYLTNSAKKRWSTKGYYDLSPREQPFNDWESRGRLGEAHRSWLEKEPQRQRFRIALDKVLEGLVERSDAAQLVALSAAIESLEELRKSNDFPAGVIREMADAAQKISEERENPISLDRIMGLLGAIARPSLAHKITALGSQTSTTLADVALICKAAVSARNQSAHGGDVTGQKLPIVSPAIRALAALCAQFDLETSGFPARSAVADLMPAFWLRDSVAELKRYLTPD